MTSRLHNDPAGSSTARVTVLQPVGYQTVFNSPRHSRHRIRRTRFLPVDRFWPRWQGLFLYPPQFESYDLIHAINRVPVIRKPFIISFESHLPREFLSEGSRASTFLRSCLVEPNCKTIIAISEWARRMFLRQHASYSNLPMLHEKLHVVYPNVELAPDVRLEADRGRKGLRIVFVGGHFARKGGVVAVRLAERALKRGLPIDMDVVSSLNIGGNIWTDPPNARLYDRDKELLGLPNVRFHGRLPNEKVIKLLRGADFSLLATLSDTFGLSVLESFSVGTPAIVTNVNALPELVTDDVNGIMVNLETDENNVWKYIDMRLRDSYWEICSSTYDRLADEILARLEVVLDDPEKLTALRSHCYAVAGEKFGSLRADAYFDNLYESVVARR